MEERTWNTYALHAKVISPNLTARSALQQGLFEGRLAIDAYNITRGRARGVNIRTTEVSIESKRRTKGVDDAFLLLLHAVHAANPLAAIAHGSNTFDGMRALKSRDEKVPYKKKKSR
jgi:hypothetical protein